VSVCLSLCVCVCCWPARPGSNAALTHTGACAHSMARELGPQGVHVAFVVIDGMVDLPSTRTWLPGRPDTDFLRPAAIAEQYYQLHAQHPSAWTQELDLRPFGEKF
jgi:hypothetical protein